METVTLKDGTELPGEAVDSLFRRLQTLAADNPVAFCGLREKCRNSGFCFLGDTGEALKERALVEQDGSISEVTRSVVLNAVEGELLEIKLVSPLQPDPEQTVAARGFKLFGAVYG